MTADDIFVTLLLAMVFGGYVAAASIAPWRRRSTRRWMRRHPYPATPELVTLVEQQRSRRSLALGLGGLLGTAVGAVLLLLGGSLLPDPLHVWLLLSTTVAGSCLGVGGRALLVATQRVTGRTRVAQIEAADLEQYVRRGPLLTIRSAAVLAAAASVVAGSLPLWSGSGLGRGVAWGGLGLLLLGWVAGEVLARRLIERPQPAGSALELRWRDALRGELVCDLLSTPAVLAVMATALAATPAAYATVGPDWALPVDVGLLVVMVVVSLGLVVALSLMSSTNPTRRAPEAAVITGSAL